MSCSATFVLGAMEGGKTNTAREFDLGRPEFDNAGLITFKDRWGATRSPLTYWRYPRPFSAPGGACSSEDHLRNKGV